MKKLLICSTILLLFSEISPQTGRTSLDDFLGVSRIFKLFLNDFSLKTQRENFSSFRKDKKQPQISELRSFPCSVKNQRSVNRPKSVHRLRPGDIDVIAAMGDSLTAGVGITAINLLELPIEERGQSFSIGGQGDWRQYVTLPNILKMFNPNILGYSLSPSLTIQNGSQLNVAEVFAISSDMTYMAKQLIKRIKSNNKIILKEDWKMITIFIGCNNFCSFNCYLKDPFSALEKHRKDMIQMLRILKNNLPRTIINFVTPPNLRIIVELKLKATSVCHLTRRVECPCLFGLPNRNKRQLLFDLMSRWQHVDEELCNLKEFDNDSFTVVYQPFLTNYSFPTIAPGYIDESLLSTDCFHWSQKAHARVANDLWNNIMEPVGKKSIDGNNLLEKFNCPTEEHPFIFTRRNS